MKNDRTTTNTNGVGPSSYLKKALLTVFKYHKSKRTILFVGVPSKVKKKYKKTLLNTRHIFLPEFYWTKGFLTNKKSLIESLKKNSSTDLKSHNLQRYLLSKKKPDLLVVLSLGFNSEILKEASKLKIPTIAVSGSDLDHFILYSVKANTEDNSVRHNNFLFHLLNSLFKKN